MANVPTKHEHGSVSRQSIYTIYMNRFEYVNFYHSYKILYNTLTVCTYMQQLEDFSTQI